MVFLRENYQHDSNRCKHIFSQTTTNRYTYADHFKNHLKFSGWANVVKEFLVKSQGEDNKKSQVKTMFGLLSSYPKIREALPLLNDLLDLDMALTAECREARQNEEMLECSLRVLFYCLVSEILK